MTIRVETVRRRFDKRAQVSLDHAKARRIIDEAKADLEAAKASRTPQDAELYVMAIRSLTRKPEETSKARKVVVQSKPNVMQAEIERVFVRLSGRMRRE